MPNLASTLKAEIRRLARKEIKVETFKTKRAVAQYRREIAELKRQLHLQEKKVVALEAQSRENGGQAAVNGKGEEKFRFSPRTVLSQRKRLKLSAEDYGKLVGVSPLTVYSWEHGRSRPRKAQLERLVATRKLGRRDALAQLTETPAKRAPANRKLRRRKPR